MCIQLQRNRKSSCKLLVDLVQNDPTIHVILKTNVVITLDFSFVPPVIEKRPVINPVNTEIATKQFVLQVSFYYVCSTL